MILLSDKFYNIAKYIVLIALPAISAAYAAAALLLNLPFSVEVVGSIGILGTLLGTLLGISTAQFQKFNTTLSNEKIAELEASAPVTDGTTVATDTSAVVTVDRADITGK